MPSHAYRKLCAHTVQDFPVPRADVAVACLSIFSLVDCACFSASLSPWKEAAAPGSLSLHEAFTTAITNICCLMASFFIMLSIETSPLRVQSALRPLAVRLQSFIFILFLPLSSVFCPSSFPSVKAFSSCDSFSLLDFQVCYDLQQPFHHC